MSDINFNIAFAVENYLESKIRIDPRYVKYMARLFTRTNNVESEKIIPFGVCTAD